MSPIDNLRLWSQDDIATLDSGAMDDMDMEMEIQLQMELEMNEQLDLMEANYQLHQDLQPPQPSPQSEQQGHKRSSPPPHSTAAPKRIRIQDDEDWLHPQPPAAVHVAEKPSRIQDEEEEEEEEEEWLHYSPPPPPPPPDTVEKVVFRYRSEIHGDAVSVTAPGSGERVYAKFSRLDHMEDRPQRLYVAEKSKGLISEPIDVLLGRLDQQAFTRALRASSGGHCDVVLPEEPVVHERLWVDKYAPNSFTELLSDEQTNREVLLWLKQWDSCVFGSEIRSTSDEVLSALRRHSCITQHQTISVPKFQRNNRDFIWNKENFKRFNGTNHENTNSKSAQELSNKSRSTAPPEQKILLLCGPPGLGKTTLAHVAAKHCGYRVVEVNASDDRSSSAIGTKITDVVQMNSVSGDLRPKCLVIDEIDGALGDGKGVVEVLLKMISADKKSDMEKENANKEQKSGKSSSKKGHKTATLSRPIICICNDLYAPSLRPLRQVAKVHVFVQPTVSRVVSRLKYICNKEGMKTSSFALTALAEHTECDIRSCLNTLQFLNKKKEALSAGEIESQVIGQKDISKGVFDVWKEIFQKRKTKREQRTNNSCGMSNEFDSLHSLVSHRGDYDLIVDGLHENFLHLPYHDPVMGKTVKCLDSLGVSDLMNRYIMRTQQMRLYVYQPTVAVIVHRLVAQVHRPNIEWPKSYYRYRTMLVEKVDSLKSWYNKIPPSISRHLSIKSFVEDSISLLLHILSPPTLRLVALHLLSEKEKNDLAQLVSTMVSYSITHKSMKSGPLLNKLRHEVADASELSFDPPISSFINFQGYRSGHHVLASTMKQMLAHEVETQRILQASIGRSEHLTDGNKEHQASLESEMRRLQNGRDELTGACTVNNGKSETMSNMRQSNPNTSVALSNLSTGNTAASTKLNSLGCTRSSRGSTSFFDRFRKLGKGSQNTAEAMRKEATSERDSRPLVFKFNEGYTNAVKRPVRVREFLS